MHKHLRALAANSDSLSRRVASRGEPFRFHDGLVAALKAHHRRQSEERLAAGGRWRDNGLVFATGIGTPLEPRALNEDFERIVGSVDGLRRVRLHDLRHACASFMIAQGVHPRVVMELLGHSQISLTMNTYSHVMPDAMKEAVRAVETLLGTPAAAG